MKITNIYRILTGKDKSIYVEEFYNNIVLLARNKNLYIKGGVPDTLDGRFELIILHFHFFIKRILLLGPKEKLFAQNLINYMFKDFDRSLREIGVGDLSVGKKVKFMVSSYYGRINIYEKSLNKNSNIIDSALKNNLYGTTNVNEYEVKYMKAYINNLIFFLDSLKNNEVLICFKSDINLYKGLSNE